MPTKYSSMLASGKKTTTKKSTVKSSSVSTTKKLTKTQDAGSNNAANANTQ